MCLQLPLLFHTRAPRSSSENSRKEMLPPASASSVSSSSSSQKPSRPAQKRPRPDEDTCSQEPPRSASSTKSSSTDPPAPKHRKVQARGSEHKVSKAASGSLTHAGNLELFLTTTNDVIATLIENMGWRSLFFSRSDQRWKNHSSFHSEFLSDVEMLA